MKTGCRGIWIKNNIKTFVVEKSKQIITKLIGRKSNNENKQILLMNYWTMDKNGIGIDNKTIWQIKDRMPTNIEKKTSMAVIGKINKWMDV